VECLNASRILFAYDIGDIAPSSNSNCFILSVDSISSSLVSSNCYNLSRTSAIVWFYYTLQFYNISNAEMLTRLLFNSLDSFDFLFEIGVCFKSIVCFGCFVDGFFYT
jgi:hypothetical protein